MGAAAALFGHACPWTLSVASVQAGGLGMVALGLAHITAARATGHERLDMQTRPPCGCALSARAQSGLARVQAEAPGN
jgi:hypothetical protein